MEYYLTKKPMTFVESGGLESVVDWKTYNEDRKPTISDSGTGTYYLFVKVTDVDGNVSYVSTEGLVVDIIAPSISFADGTSPEMYETYVGTQKIVIKDNHLVSVTVDGNEIMLSPDLTFEFEVRPSMGTEQVIVATDSFGHSTKIIIIVEPKEYTIQIDLNNGTGTIDAWNVYEAEANLLPFLPEDCEAPYGKELAGWAIGSVDSDIVIAPGQEYIFEGNTTIYAIWKNITYTIDYVLDGGTNAVGNPASFDKDTSAITLHNPTKEGYVFLGWTWEAGLGIGTEEQTTPIKDVVIPTGSIQNKCFVANWEKMTDVIDRMVDDIPELDDVTSEDKTLVDDTLDIIDELLSEPNVGSLTPQEIAKVTEQKEQLEELREKIEAIEEKLGAVEETVTDLPKADEVTSEDKEKIEEALDIIEDLLADENVGNLTQNEKETVESLKDELTEKLEEIVKAEEKMEAVEETVANLPKADEVTSEDKEKIEEALDIIEDLLADENVGNLTQNEKETVESLKDELTEKLEEIVKAEEKMEAVEETVANLPKADEVTSEDKEKIEEALDIIEDLLADENVGNLTENEKETVESQKAELTAKLEIIVTVEEKMQAVEEIVTALPKADKVTSDHKATIEEVLELIEELLAEENVGNLTEAEKAIMESQKAELTKKLDIIQMVEDSLAELQNKEDDIPSKDVITTEYKDEILELLDIMDDLKENHPNNLTKEQKEMIACLQDELQEKNDRIQKIEASLNEIKKDSVVQPDYKDITSDNKEDIKGIIKDIENLLNNEKENLTGKEIEELSKQKKELENKVAFIKKLEMYTPVSNDYKNVTKPENNANNGNLENSSHELIGIIPLEKTEKEHVAKGEGVKVYLEVTDITNTVTEAEKELIEAAIEDKKVAVYLDLTLFKQIGGREPKKVPNTKGNVTISFRVPSNLINQDASVTEKYQIVRIHEGKISIIDTVFNEATGIVSFETDKFSTYALIYGDVEVNAPQTGDTTSAWPWILFVLGCSMIVLSIKLGSEHKVKKR